MGVEEDSRRPVGETQFSGAKQQRPLLKPLVPNPLQPCPDVGQQCLEE